MNDEPDRGPMFSLSHPVDGTFRLEIHASPSELDGTDSRRLRSVLLGLARELKETQEDEETDDDTTRNRTLPARRTVGALQREAS